ncbi:hypothetical protein BFJ63_vAg50 [Fusarium oxysporum f. sp. narcissi]|uniref:Uncharacterized protein n=1 Tax=Fusarium oxysporum f. sp. narcissi TaxID=451672 RepID=A0A4Q2WBZ2_FUSOX|nr:hypothetical protein BFJ66_g16313 [Fusarium oxysporum f. sp. cepae]RKK39990.1 hypothetical protein BFJ67_g11170 [Fusarium oxysporum f. sp. cepae]RYC96883.1 hypothetical protein BFJ63_vAg50 [Fusarium oxysporum f. sp. narcissi]
MTSPHLATYMVTSAYLVRFWSTITSGSVITELVTVETIIPGVAPYYEACGLKALLSKSNGGNGVILTINGNLAYLPNTYTDANTLGGYNYCVECMGNPGCLLSQADGSMTFSGWATLVRGPETFVISFETEKSFH